MSVSSFDEALRMAAAEGYPVVELVNQHEDVHYLYFMNYDLEIFSEEGVEKCEILGWDSPGRVAYHLADCFPDIRDNLIS